MLVNRDPDDKPRITEAMVRRAKESGMIPVQVLCVEPGAKTGDGGAINFIALVAAVPRPGERIVLENERLCRVTQIYHTVAKFHDDAGRPNAIALLANVVAELLPDKSDD